MWQRSDEQVEVQRYTGLEFVRGDLESEGRSRDHQLGWGWGSYWVRNLGTNLVNIQTGSMVHWGLAFITTGDYAGS